MESPFLMPLMECRCLCSVSLCGALEMVTVETTVYSLVWVTSQASHARELPSSSTRHTLEAPQTLQTH